MITLLTGGVYLLPFMFDLVQDIGAVQIKRVQHNFSDLTTADEYESESLSYSIDTTNAIVLLTVESSNMIAPDGKGGADTNNGPRLAYFRKLLT